MVKLDTMHQASRGETPAALGQCEWGLICYLFYRFQKTQEKRQNICASADYDSLQKNRWMDLVLQTSKA